MSSYSTKIEPDNGPNSLYIYSDMPVAEFHILWVLII